jgi:hypothetical protein
MEVGEMGFARNVGREGIFAREPNLVEGMITGFMPDGADVFSGAGQGTFLGLSGGCFIFF